MPKLEDIRFRKEIEKGESKKEEKIEKHLLLWKIKGRKIERLVVSIFLKRTRGLERFC